MKFGREAPGGPNGYGPNGYGPNGYMGPQGFPGQVPMMPPPGHPGNSPGSIRNTLGSGLKSSGFFQKDGQIHNMRGGFIGQKQGLSGAPGYPAFPPGNYGQTAYPANPGGTGFPAGGGMPGAPLGPGIPGVAGMHGTPSGPGETTVSGGQGMVSAPGWGGSGGGNMGKGPFSFLGSNEPSLFQARQLILEPAGDGITGNGVATISPDNTFVMVANLPPPYTFQTMQSGGRASVVYATYLVDKKGKNGFLAGVLSPVGNGMYRAHFRSQVPLTSYERVIVSVENPQYLGPAPNGMVVLRVKEPMGPMAVLTPIKNAAGSLWGKIAGLTKRGAKLPLPGAEIAVPEVLQSLPPNGVPTPAPIPPPSPMPPVGGG